MTTSLTPIEHGRLVIFVAWHRENGTERRVFEAVALAVHDDGTPDVLVYSEFDYFFIKKEGAWIKKAFEAETNSVEILYMTGSEAAELMSYRV